MDQALKDKLKKVKLLILDVDGILTNGEIIVTDKGQETKHFNVQDGFGIVLLQKAGYQTAIISARASEAVVHRAKDLGINHVYLDSRNKMEAYREVLQKSNLSDEDVCFMGDDLPDLAVFQTAGLAITVPNARSEIKEKADYITQKEGGRGAVREVVELILDAQGKWVSIIEEYSK